MHRFSSGLNICQARRMLIKVSTRCVSLVLFNNQLEDSLSRKVSIMHLLIHFSLSTQAEVVESEGATHGEQLWLIAESQHDVATTHE